MNLKEKMQKNQNSKRNKITMKNLKKQVKGITLIALVVTIIVLLILAGVAISLTIGQNGIFARAQIAANTWKNAEANEQLAMGELANWIGNVTPQQQETISKDDLQISSDNVYYADIDDDGIVDGVIFVDLAGPEENGQWNNSSNGSYSIPDGTSTIFKQYYINGEHTDSHFGPGKVIAPMKGTNGSDRFYVMALNNIGLCYWYHTAKFLDSKYIVSASANDFAEEGAEPTGRVNTLRMVASWNSSQYGAQTTTGNIIDMWGIIQEEVTNGWFVPSKSEWAAFGDSFDISSNYSSTFGLSNTCWTSSQSSIYTAYDVYFNLNGFIGKIQNTNVQVFSYVRLATTF